MSLRSLALTVSRGVEARCCAGDVETEQGGGFGSGADLEQRGLERRHTGVCGHNSQMGLRSRLAPLLCRGALC